MNIFRIIGRFQAILSSIRHRFANVGLMYSGSVPFGIHPDSPAENEII